MEIRYYNLYIYDGGPVLRIALRMTILILLFAGGAAASGLIFTGYETRVTADVGDQYDPAIESYLPILYSILNL